MTAPAPLLEIRNLQIGAGAFPILHGVDFTMRPGRIAALVGESGSGKTMLARSILKLLPPGARIAGGSIRLAGEDIVPASERRMRALRGPVAGMVFQEPMVSLNPAISIGAQLAEAMRQHTTLSRQEIRERAVAMLRRVRIANPAECLSAYPHQFSGGMRQRIMLASVMLLKPSLLIADEPTTALDTLSQKEVLDLMVELARDSGTAVLLITHNLGLVTRYAQEMTVLKQGRVVESGATVEIVAAAQQPYTRELIAAARRGGASPDLPPLREAQPCISARNVSVRYPGRPELAADNVSLTVHRGETLALVGGSGSGKTTMGRALLGLVPLSSGSVAFAHHAISTAAAKPSRDMRLACQMVFQDPYSSLDPRQRIGAIVGEPLRHTALSASEKRARISEVLNDVGLSGLDRRFPHELSGGQRQRVAVARAVVRHPVFVVADEPISALDMTIQAQVLELIKSLQRRYGFACLFISHDLSAVRQIAHRIVVMEAGRVVEEGPSARVLEAPGHPYTRSLVDAAPLIEATAEVKAA